MREVLVYMLIASILTVSVYAYAPHKREIRASRSMYKRIAFKAGKSSPAKYITSGLAASMFAVLTYPFWALFYMSTGVYSSSAKPPMIGLCCIMSNIIVLIPAYWQLLPGKCRYNNYLRQQYNNGFIAGIILNIILYIVSFAALLGNQD